MTRKVTVTVVDSPGLMFSGATVASSRRLVSLSQTLKVEAGSELEVSDSPWRTALATKCPLCAVSSSTSSTAVAVTLTIAVPWLAGTVKLQGRGGLKLTSAASRRPENERSS